MATYSPLSFGSPPGTMPTTLRAGSAIGTTSNRTATVAVVPGAPGVSWSSGVVNILAAAAPLIRNTGGCAAGAAGLSSSTVRGRRRNASACGAGPSGATSPTARAPGTPGVSRRHEARALDLGGDVVGASDVADRSGLASLHRIVGEDVQPRHQVAGRDRRDGRHRPVGARQLGLGSGGGRRA